MDHASLNPEHCPISRAIEDEVRTVKKRRISGNPKLTPLNAVQVSKATDTVLNSSVYSGTVQSIVPQYPDSESPKSPRLTLMLSLQSNG